jgi:tetratricopeptide (TPR) repeat protein
MAQPDKGTLPDRPGAEGVPTELSQKAVYGGRYALEQQLGRGGMGRVFRARDLKIGRIVALKVLNPGAERERFEQEARAAGALNHPHIVAVYDVGEEGGEPYIVSELLEGETLRAALADGPLAPAEAMELATQLADGTAAAHRKGIVHRDLKPDNLFLTDGGHLKILDFGIAKLLPKAGGVAFSTETGEIIGTPAYMSPEQARGEAADTRSDVFACGAVIHEMLSGKAPFGRATSLDSAYAVLHEAPPALAAGPLATIVARCLAKDPAARYSTAVELLLDLTAVARGERIAAGRRMRRRATIIAAGMLVSALVLMTVAILFGRQRQPRASAPSKDLIAVLPFIVRGTGQSNYLSEGMVDLLSTTLASRSMRTVDPHALLALATREGWTPDPHGGRALAARFLARQYVLGTVVEVGTRLRIHASVYEAGSETGPVREASVEGESSKIFELVDELSEQIRNGTEAAGRRSPGERLIHLAQVTTSSAGALAAYLEGAQAKRRGRHEQAVAAFQRAIAADPSFALAHFSIAYTIGVYQVGDRQLANRSLASALQLRAALPAQDQMRLDALNAFAFENRYLDAERYCREILRTHPDDVDTWYLLGEVLVHWGHSNGRTINELKEPLERVLALDPASGEPLIHLLQLTLISGDRDELLKLLDRYLELEFAEHFGMLLEWRWIRTLLRNDRQERGQVLKELGKSSAATQGRAFWATLQLPGKLADAGEVASIAPVPWLHVRHAIVTGRIAHARNLFDDAFVGKVGEERAVEVARWSDLIRFYRLDRTELEADRRAVEDWRPADVESRYFRASWLGRMSASVGDLAGAERAVNDFQELQAAPHRVADATSWIRAIAAWKASRPREALAALEAIDGAGLAGSPLRQVANPWQDVEYLRAELLFSLGRHEEAARWFLVFNSPSVADLAIAPRSRRLAQIEEKRGNALKAIAYYERFIELWDGCDPELRPQVDEARSRLGALRK